MLLCMRLLSHKHFSLASVDVNVHWNNEKWLRIIKTLFEHLLSILNRHVIIYEKHNKM